MHIKTFILCLAIAANITGCSHNTCIWDKASSQYVWTCYEDNNIERDYEKGYILEENFEYNFLSPNMALIKSEQISSDNGRYLDLVFAYLSACKVKKIEIDNLENYLNLLDEMKKSRPYEFLIFKDVWLLHFIYNVVLVSHFGIKERLPISFCNEAKEWFFSHPRFKDIPKSLPQFIYDDIRKLR